MTVNEPVYKEDMQCLVEEITSARRVSQSFHPRILCSPAAFKQYDPFLQERLSKIYWLLDEAAKEAEQILPYFPPEPTGPT